MNCHNNYMPGFGNDFETEALPGALPQGQNSPQKCPYGLYAEQLSGSPFTAPRGENERSWLYRIRPSVSHSKHYVRVNYPLFVTAPDTYETSLALGQYRWDAIEAENNKMNFIEGIRTISTAGDVNAQAGMGVHIYLANESMQHEYFNNADGELMIVPQEGRITICTELGEIELEPCEIAVIPRGTVFQVKLLDPQVRGFICENYGAKFTLPDRGPIGANCLANPRDFKTPVASWRDEQVQSTITMKWCGQFHQTVIDQSPLDVVAWHGNYAPYKYDLRTYSPVGAILFDHPDPSIFTVLTAPSETPGTANIDFVIFPERWMVAEHSFRPPWYHRNIMSEFMGLIQGQYDAKPSGFTPGGFSLHNMMLPHGPDAEAYNHAVNEPLQPVKLTNTLAFMFESRLPQKVTKFASETPSLQKDYISCWVNMPKKFDGTPEAR